jgi:hypothetical protein
MGAVILDLGADSNPPARPPARPPAHPPALHPRNPHFALQADWNLGPISSCCRSVKIRVDCLRPALHLTSTQFLLSTAQRKNNISVTFLICVSSNPGQHKKLPSRLLPTRHACGGCGRHQKEGRKEGRKEERKEGEIWGRLACLSLRNFAVQEWVWKCTAPGASNFLWNKLNVGLNVALYTWGGIHQMFLQFFYDFSTIFLQLFPVRIYRLFRAKS